MRVNVYAEEMTDRVELIRKNIDGHDFTAIRFYLELPATVAGPDGLTQAQGPFIHRPGDDDSAAVTFWGKDDMRPLLRKGLALLDQHYGEWPGELPGIISLKDLVRGKSPVQSVLEELERSAIVALESVPGEAKVRKFAITPELILEAVGLNGSGAPHDYCRVVTSDLPADFATRHAYWDHVNHRLVVVGTSESFTSIDLTTEPIPDIVPTMSVALHQPATIGRHPADPSAGNDDAAGSHAKSGEGHWVQRAAFDQAKQDVRVLYQMIRAGEDAGDILDDEEGALLYQIAHQWNLEPRPKKIDGPQAHALLVFPGRAPGRFQVTEMLLTFDPEDGATEAARFCSLAYHEDVGINGLDMLNDANALLNDGAESDALAAYGVATVNSCQPIFREVEQERVAQDRQWGGAGHDDSHDAFDWAHYIDKQLGLARGAALNADQFEQRMVKVAALAVAAIQSSRRCALLKA